MSELGELLPSLVTAPPGPRSRAITAKLRSVESRGVTKLDPSPPIVWSEARGANVRDPDGNVYLDLTAAFGVALAGHAHPAVVDAITEQARRLLHGMGDVHPPALKVGLLARLSELAPWDGAVGVLASTGSEAVEIALKTALLRTSRPGILAFEGGYHGLTVGALAATARPYFRDPFRSRLYPGVTWAPFPGSGDDPQVVEEALASVESALQGGGPGGERIGAIIVEPVQGRAGVRVPPPGFLGRVTQLAHRHDALVIADEILTGLGRCGAPLASARLGFEPDLVCLGKALGGGVPISACLGHPDVMDAWAPSPGEAIHTSTFLGHPLGCAAGLAMLDLLEAGLDQRAEQVGTALRGGLREELAAVPGVVEVRGLGAAVGIQLGEPGTGRPFGQPAIRVAEAALARGVIVLAAGDHSQVVELTPPVCLTTEQTAHAIAELSRAVLEVLG